MPFVLIRGTFHIKGFSPDGDSLRFRAADSANWTKLHRGRAMMNRKDMVQLRYEGIDAPETHFEGCTQPVGVAREARDFNIKCVGFDEVNWNRAQDEVNEASGNAAGYILTREAERYGRPVSFVFHGAPPPRLRDGGEVMLRPEMLRKSVNYKLVEAGLAYPAYYEGLFSDLREVFSEAVRAARKAKRGVWAADATNEGVSVQSLEAVTYEAVIFPKLFRRIVAWVKSTGSIAGFVDALREKDDDGNNRDPLLVLPEGHFTCLGDIVSQRGSRVRLNVQPENIVFRPV